jgi:hypothetical protein
VVELTSPSLLELKIFDTAGELVYETQTQGAPGLNTLSWNLRNLSGRSVANGLYVYWFEVVQGFKPQDQTGKVLVLR